MKIIKADNYQTWYLENFDKSILIDPWLTNKLQPKDSFSESYTEFYNNLFD